MPLAIFDNDYNRITSEDDQIAIITDYFSKLFSSEDRPSNVTPVMMEPPYTAGEIETAAGKLKKQQSHRAVMK